MKTVYLSTFLALFLLTSCYTVRVAEERPYEPVPQYPERPAPPPRDVVVYEEPRYEPAPLPDRSPAPPPVYVEQTSDPYYENDDYREPRSPDYREDRLRRIQIALILDTSGSMEDLLEHAKLEFWYIIDELMASYAGPNYPMLEVALYQYGADRRGRYNDYIRQVVPLTTDLDWIADELWQLRSKGDREFDGLVIDRAVQELNWNYQPGTVKMIYIIGNETFRDGPVHPQTAIENACDRGIGVHTLFCGSYREGQRMGWEESSWCGTYTALDYRAPVESYVSSYDVQINQLNIIYNQTFLPYGDFGVSSYDRCIRQDGYLRSYGPAWVSVRTVVKSGPYYSNPQWDLIDAIDRGRVTLRDLPREQWPVSLRGRTMREAESIISDKRKQRTQLQAQIRRLNQDRRKEIQQARARKPSEQRQYRSIDQAVMGTIRSGAEAPTRKPKTPRNPVPPRQDSEGPTRSPNPPKQGVEAPTRTPVPPRKDLEEQRKKAEILRQKQLEQERREAEIRRQKQLEEQRKEAEIRRQKQLEQDRREAEIRRQKQQEAQRKEAEIRRQKQLEQDRREAEIRRQKQIEEQRKEAEIRRQKQLEQDRREAEIRRQKQQEAQGKEAEARRQRELEQQRKEAEIRRQKQQEAQRKEAEARRQRELEQQRKEAEIRRQKQQEAQRKEAEARRQRELEQQRKEAEIRRQKQQEAQRKEAEARRQRELEQQRKEAEIRRQKQQEVQRKEAEARRQRELEQQRKEAEIRRQKQQEVQRKEAEARRQRQQEQQRKEAEARKQQPQTRKASGTAVRRR